MGRSITDDDREWLAAGVARGGAAGYAKAGGLSGGKLVVEGMLGEVSSIREDDPRLSLDADVLPSMGGFASSSKFCVAALTIGVTEDGSKCGVCPSNTSRIWRIVSSAVFD